jgi:hypothetical protein
MRKTTKLLIAFGVLFLGIQAIRPEKNLSNDQTYDISKKYTIPDEVNDILKVACNDCHSNYTRYPWYAEVQPAAWWLASHVNDGKKHLNYSEFLKRPIAVQNHKFEETIEMVKEKEMPLPSYTYFGLHADAKLTDEQRVLLTTWAQAQMDMLKATYPADSLVMPKRR